jgi:hypothetical protein
MATSAAKHRLVALEICVLMKRVGLRIQARICARKGCLPGRQYLPCAGTDSGVRGSAANGDTKDED